MEKIIAHCDKIIDELSIDSVRKNNIYLLFIELEFNEEMSALIWQYKNRYYKSIFDNLRKYIQIIEPDKISKLIELNITIWDLIITKEGINLSYNLRKYILRTLFSWPAGYKKTFKLEYEQKAYYLLILYNLKIIHKIHELFSHLPQYYNIYDKFFNEKCVYYLSEFNKIHHENPIMEKLAFLIKQELIIYKVKFSPLREAFIAAVIRCPT